MPNTAQSKKSISLLIVCLPPETNDPMEAIEFNAQIQDGKIIVPPRFRSFLNKKVKVIVLADTADPYEDLKESLIATNKAAREAGLDKMTLEEIDAEIAAVRNGD